MQRNKKNIKECCLLQNNQRKNLYPFLCDHCNVYYSEYNCSGNHKICQSCDSKICIRCLMDGRNYQEMKQLLGFLPELSSIDNFEVCKNEIPSEGLFINLKSQEKRAYFFKAIEHKQKTHIFVNQQGKVKIWLTLKKKRDKKKFMKDFYLLRSPNFKEETPKITLEEANNDFFIP